MSATADEITANMLSDDIDNAEGFLEVVYRETCANHAEAVLHLQAKNITDSEQLLRKFSEFPETRFSCYLDAEAQILRKNKQRSKQLRDEGNKAYSRRRNQEAIKLYTQSIRFAPYTILEDHYPAGSGEELALAYANRSAALVQIEDYESALSDITFALRANYPKDLQYKLYERRGRCHVALQEDSAALQAFTICIQAIEESKLTGDKRTALETEINNLTNTLNQDNVRDKSKRKNTKIKLEIKDKNPRFPAFSSAVEIRYEAGRGRFGVASRDIPLGELICVEDPPCAFLHEETTGLNCSHCFRISAAPLPSPLCTQNVFCSWDCQKRGMENYHVVESKFMDVLFQNGLKKKEWFLALRAVTLRPLSFFKEIQNSLDHNPLLGAQTDSDSVYSSDDFFSLYNLVSHHESWTFKEHAYKAFFALFFVRCLQKSNYFGDTQSNDETLGEDERLIGKIIIHLMEVATMNSHEIGQLQGEADVPWLKTNATPVGCAIEPSMVLLNHSCDPSFSRVNQGTSTYCFATKFIKKGEEITDSYSLTFDLLSKSQRQPDLERKYKFSCRCVCCEFDWKTFHELPKSFNDLPESQLKIKPQDMMSLQGLMKDVQTLGVKIHKLQQAEDYKAAKIVYPEFVRALGRLIEPPHQFYVIARRSYGTCLWVEYGSKVRNV